MNLNLVQQRQHMVERNNYKRPRGAILHLKNQSSRLRLET